MNTKIARCGTAAGLSLALIASLSAAPHVARVFGAAQEQARTASAANMKRLGTAFSMYEQDYDDREPSAATWTDGMRDYLVIGSARGATLRDLAAPAGVKYSYAFNRSLSRKPVAAIKRPAKTVLLFESTKNVKNASDTGQSVPRPGRHKGGSLFLFADGSVKWISDRSAKPSFKLSGK